MSVAPLVLLLLFLFTGFLLLLRQILTRYATQATGHLQTLSQETLAQHEQLKRQLEETERQHKAQLAKAQEEANELKAKALQDVESARQQVLDQAHQEAERIVQQATQAREALQRELQQAIDARALERACELIRQVLPKQLRDITHAQWVDELLTNGFVRLDRVQAREKVEEARVTSAAPLSSAQRKQLQERLRAVLGHDVKVTESIDPSLVAGLIVTLGHLVLDGSLVSKFQEAARRAQDSQ